MELAAGDGKAAISETQRKHRRTASTARAVRLHCLSRRSRRRKATPKQLRARPLPAPFPPNRKRALSVAETTIRVDVSLLDKLMNLIGELVLARNQILQFTTQREDVALNGASQRLNLITSELQEGFMKTRMQPIGVVWNKLPRVVRDVANLLGKQIDLQMEGADTELDRTIIEAIKDPLTHLVRNSCDHGIEDPERRRRRAANRPKGRLPLRPITKAAKSTSKSPTTAPAWISNACATKAVERGLIRADQAAQLSEREAMSLLFLPGFSTAGQVTNVSGRGVGMDVVKSNVEKIGGSVDIVSHLRAGHHSQIENPAHPRHHSGSVDHERRPAFRDSPS